MRKIKTITIQLSDDEHYEMKIFLAEQKLTLKEYFISCLRKSLEENEKKKR